MEGDHQREGRREGQREGLSGGLLPTSPTSLDPHGSRPYGDLPSAGTSELDAD